MDALTIFSEDETSIGAECPRCRRVLKIQKASLVTTTDGFNLRRAIMCPCGKTYGAIVRIRVNPTRRSRVPRWISVRSFPPL